MTYKRTTPGILNKRQNTTDYEHPQETNLLAVERAMQYRWETGEPELRVNLGSNAFVISGNVNIPGYVTVVSSPENPNHVHVSEVGTSGILTNPWLPVAGNVRLDAGTNSIGNVRVTDGSISVTNFPAFPSNISITSMPGITGHVSVDNFPANVSITQLPALGNVSITQLPAINGNVNVNNFPSNIRITDMPGITGNVGVSGNVDITRMPAISGNVNVNNFPSNVSITSMPAVTGNVSVTQGSSPWHIDGNVSATIVGNVTLDTTVPPLIAYADTIQMDSNDRLRVSVIGQQWWYVPSIDKDGDLRIQEAFQGNVNGNVASSTFIQNLSSVRMTPGLYYNANAKLTGSAIRASRRRHKTRPGVTGEWMGIVNWDGLQNNVVKRIGMFTSYNGVFFEANSTSINAVVRRRLTDGTLLEDRIPHTAWNQDQMNGLGPSKYNWSAPAITANVTSVVSQANVAISGDGNVYQVTYQLPAGEETRIPVGHKVTLTGLTPTTFNDTGMVTSIDTVNHLANVAYVVYPGTYSSATSAQMTNTPFHAMHTYWFDFNGSRTTRVRFGMLTDAGKVLCHEYVAGEIGSQFISAPAMMDRKEIINVGQPVAFLPSMTVGGSSVTIETQSEINPGFGMCQTTTPIAFNKNSNVGSEFAIVGVGIRIGEPYQRSDLQINQFQIVDLGNLNPQNAGIFQWRLVLNPTVTGTVTTTNVGKASRQLTYSAGTTVSGGITLLSGYAQGTWTGDVQTALNFLNMGSNIDYTDSDVVVLMVKMLVGGTDNSSVMGTINYTEDL
jgi:hypothetical protein